MRGISLVSRDGLGGGGGERSGSDEFDVVGASVEDDSTTWRAAAR